MLEYLCVSLDILLIYCSEQVYDITINDLEDYYIKCVEIGYVVESNHFFLSYNDKEKKEILPKFKESAYTKIKQEIGEETPKFLEIMEKNVENAAIEALEKRKKIIEYILKQE